MEPADYLGGGGIMTRNLDLVLLGAPQHLRGASTYLFVCVVLSFLFTAYVSNVKTFILGCF